MRVNIVKSKNAEQLYIIKSFRRDGKGTSQIVKKLGSMESLLPLHNNSREDVILWAKEQAALLTQQEKENTLELVLNLSPSLLINKDKLSSFNLSYLFLQDIFFDLKLDKICNSIASQSKLEYNLSDILAKLVYSRILSPSSKLSTFEFSKSLIEQPDFDLHHIYRALDVLSEYNDFIQSQLYKNSTSVIEREASVLYYDCSNFYFEIEEAEGLKQYGKSKEHRPNPIVQMGLFMDGNGIPLSFVIFPGNESEQPSLIPLEKKIIKDFKLSKFIVCTDAGLASNSNRQFNNKKDRSFIVTQSLKKLKAHLREWALDPTGWYLNGSEKEYNLNDIDDNDYFNQIFYKERWIHENDLEQRFIVSYSPKYKNYQRKVREGQIDRAKKSVQAKTKNKTRNPNSSSRYVKETKTTDLGEVAKESHYELDVTKIDQDMEYDGFYGVCTTLEDDIEEIIKINKQRWEIEATFRIMKTDFKSRPVYVQTDKRIEAHFLTCFISLVVYRILEKKLDNKYTSEEIINTLRDMTGKHYEGYGYIPTYTRTQLTDDLHSVFGFRTDTEIISEKNIKKIIRKTKA